MSPGNDQPEQEFELVKELGKGVWLATKKGDPEKQQFLARRMDEFDLLHDAVREGRDLNLENQGALAYKDLLYEYNQATALSRILNHENIVSLAGTIHLKPFVGAETHEDASAEDYLVWDFCDAANLSVLFQDHPHTRESFCYYLPESLCWHVLTSLVRAVSWLHDGVRRSIPTHEDEDEEWSDVSLLDEKVAFDNDWLSILHRDIKPKNIWFQHPRGIETYGLCKLGDFSKAAVVAREGNKKMMKDGGRLYGYSITKREDWEPLATSHRKFYGDPELDQPEDRVYSIEDEYYSIGVVLFTMMTGKLPSRTCEKCGCCHMVECAEPPCCDIQLCDCPKGGCSHIDGKPYCTPKANPKPCTHNCTERPFNISSMLSRSRYSHSLINLVRSLLRTVDPKNRKPVVVDEFIFQTVEEEYLEWKEDTEDGREYKDVADDVRRRAMASTDKEDS